MEERWRGSLLPRELFTSMWYYLKCLIKASDSFVSLKRESLSATGVPRSQGEAVPSAIAVSNACWATCLLQEWPLGVLGLWCTKLSFFALKRGQRKLSPTSVPRGCCGLSHAAPPEHTASWGWSEARSSSYAAARVQIEKHIKIRKNTSKEYFSLQCGQ